MSQVKQIGDLFKQRRNELGLTLKEVENATSIRSSYLRSIEEGELSKLISPVYAKGFVQQYAIYLDIDGEKIIEDHPHIFERTVNQEFSYGIGTLEYRGSTSNGVKWLPNAAWIVASVLITLGAWYFAKYLEVI